MRKKIFVVVVGWAILCGVSQAQDSKMKFAVGYTDGTKMQTGLTPEQRKYWDKEGTKKFKGMCLDFAKPDYMILWSVGVAGKELAESGVGNFNRSRETGQATSVPNQAGSDKTSTTDSRWTDSTLFIRSSSQVRAKAEWHQAKRQLVALTGLYVISDVAFSSLDTPLLAACVREARTGRGARD